MKRLLPYIMFLLLLAGCGRQSDKKQDDPLEAGREFIDASLKGKYEDARKYLLQDSTNVEYFNRLMEFNNKMDDHQKEGYRNANIIINSAENVSDSVMIINYSNTFKNSPNKIKMVKVNKQWLVDFKYTFSGNM